MRIKRIVYKYRELILYSIIGGICASLDFGIYTLLSLWIPFLWANIISVHCGITCSFLLNRNLNFKVKDNTLKRFVSFYLVGLVGLGLSELLIYLLTNYFEWNHIIAKLLTIVAIALFQFTLNKFITFNKRKLVRNEHLSDKQSINDYE